jgi:hypothetical protein
MIVPESIAIQMWGDNVSQVSPIKRCKCLNIILTIILLLIGFLIGFLTLFLIDYYTTEKNNICYSI